MYKKPGTPEEALAHFGVKGMRWGSRKGASKSGSPVMPHKPTTMDIHQARRNQMARFHAVRALEDKRALATTDKGRAHIDKMLKKSANAFVNHPDAKVAARLTKGEKWLAGIAWGTIGLTALSTASAVARTLYLRT